MTTNTENLLTALDERIKALGRGALTGTLGSLYSVLENHLQAGRLDHAKRLAHVLRDAFEVHGDSFGASVAELMEHELAIV
jgi:hypothetical protein